MTIYQHAVQQIENALPAEGRFWLHLSGRDGSGRRELAAWLCRRHLRRPVVLDLDLRVFALSPGTGERWFLRRLFRHFRGEVQRFLATLPRRQAGLIRHYLEAPEPPESARNGEVFEYQILTVFLKFLAAGHQPLIILHDPWDVEGGFARRLLALLVRHPALPVGIITTGAAEPPAADIDPDHVHIPLDKLSVRATERLVLAQTGTSPLNARLITNGLYVKSGGNVRRIRFMLAAFFQPLLGSDPQAALDHEALQQVRPGATEAVIFTHLLAQMPPSTVELLALLSRLDDPFPREWLMHLMREAGLERADYTRWLENGWVGERSFLGRRFVLIDWPAWKAYLRKHAALTHLEDPLKRLAPLARRRRAPWPLELSGLFHALGERDTALDLALREARQFRELGALSRAMDRYGFLRRNLTRDGEDADPRLNAVLEELAAVQEAAGLVENGFETLRELRDRLPRTERRHWILTSLKMADLLFRMDALAEARYLIQDLRIKGRKSPYTTVYTEILLGELEANSGRADMAQRHYEMALDALPDLRDERLAMRLYRTLKPHYLELARWERYLHLLDRVAEGLPATSVQRPFIDLERIRFHVSRHQWREALPLAIALYRRHPAGLTPPMAAQVHLYLADIYGYLGKWRLTRAHLRAVLNDRLLLPHLRGRLQVLLNLGVVEKELGCYGSALEHLETALSLCPEGGDTRRIRQQIRMHLGHQHLLVSGLLRAREHLTAALKWAEAEQDQELLISAALFMASYELQQERLESAERYLQQAEVALSLSGDPVDRLNFRYYQILWQLAAGRPVEAETSAREWAEEARGWVKFELLSAWLLGRSLVKQERLDEARVHLDAAREAASRRRVPAVEVQIWRDWCDLAARAGDIELLDTCADEARQAFNRFLAVVGDAILQRQLQESQRYEALPGSG